MSTSSCVARTSAINKKILKKVNRAIRKLIVKVMVNWEYLLFGVGFLTVAIFLLIFRKMNSNKRGKPVNTNKLREIKNWIYIFMFAILGVVLILKSF